VNGGSARNQLVINVGFSAVKSASLILSIRFADMFLVAHVLGLVLLFRRMGSLGGNLAQLGLSQALRKYYLAAAERPARARLWESLTRWGVIIAIAAVLISILFAGTISRFVFGDTDRILSFSLGLYAASTSLFFIAGTSWAVEFKLIRYNLTDWLNGSLVFVLCLLLAPALSPNYFLLLLALAGLLGAVVSLVWFRRTFVTPYLNGSVPWSITSDVWSYGLTRALTAFCDLGTTVLGPWLLSERPEEAAYLIIAYMIIRIAQSAVLPVALVYALRANDATIAGGAEMRRMRMFVVVSVAAAFACVALYYPLAPYAVPLIAPNSYVQVTAVVDRLIPFLPAVFGFYALRNFVDIRYHFPLNLCALLASMAALLAVVWFRGIVSLDSVVEGSMAMFGVFYVYVAAIGVAMFRAEEG
jgi:hypothetical protein